MESKTNLLFSGEEVHLRFGLRQRVQLFFDHPRGDAHASFSLVAGDRAMSMLEWS